MFVLDFLDGTPPYIRESITEAVNDANGGRNVLSHCDLTPRNIIVQDGRIKGLLGWEYVGWYPLYWEFVKFFVRPTGCKDWKSFAGTMFEVLYPRELLVFQALSRWQRPWSIFQLLWLREHINAPNPTPGSSTGALCAIKHPSNGTVPPLGAYNRTNPGPTCLQDLDQAFGRSHHTSTIGASPMCLLPAPCLRFSNDLRCRQRPAKLG